MRPFLCFVLLASVTALPHKSFHGRIIGGTEVKPGEFPYLVSLNDDIGDQYCDGAIINKNWIATAAHCVVDMSTDFVVLAGTPNQKEGGVVKNISKLIAHEDYDPDSVKNDMGLIKIEGEFEFSDLIQPIEISNPDVNTTCTVAGWGQAEHNPFPKIALHVEETTLDLETCQNYFNQHPTDGFYLGEEQVCGWAPEGKGACFGDSGSPLVCNGKLAGVVSYAIYPCAQGFPDVYTRVSTYSDWIQKTIQD